MAGATKGRNDWRWEAQMANICAVCQPPVVEASLLILGAYVYSYLYSTYYRGRK